MKFRYTDVSRYNEKQCGGYFEKLLNENNVLYVREYVLPASFDGEHKGRNVVDFLIDKKIIIEFKCVSFLNKARYFQC